MEVILLEKIGKLGNIGDKASVKAGFGTSKEDGRLFQTFFFNT